MIVWDDEASGFLDRIFGALVAPIFFINDFLFGAHFIFSEILG